MLIDLTWKIYVKQFNSTVKFNLMNFREDYMYSTKYDD